MDSTQKPITNSKTSSLQSSYDRVAETYAQRFHDEPSRKPFDRLMLNWLVEKVGGSGMICDLGCGPGQITRYLHDRGASVCGIDLSAGMVEQARLASPDIPFEQGDMCDLSGVADGSFGGIAAFYSIIHVPPERLPEAFSEMRRVLKSGGLLLMTFHIGDEVRHLEEWWGEAVSLDFYFYEREPIKMHLKNAGFMIEEALERDPYPEQIEVQTRRAYLLARKPE